MARGRTFLNRFVIIDEAQNITPKQMKALLTRATLEHCEECVITRDLRPEPRSGRQERLENLVNRYI